MVREFEEYLRARLLDSAPVFSATSENILPGSSHEQLERPYIVYDVSYRRDLDLTNGGAWVAEIALLVWCDERDQALDLADGARAALSTAARVEIVTGLAAHGIADVAIEPFDIDLSPGHKVFGVLVRLEALIDATP